MSVKLRLRRMGRKKLPIWGVVATDSRSPRDGRFIEDLGRYYPLDQPARIDLKDERLMYWLEQGAQPSDTVRSILSKEGLLLAFHMKRKGKSAAEIEEAVSAHRASQAEKDGSKVGVTAKERRQKALAAELETVKKLEAEEAKARAEAEAKAKAEAEAKAKAEQEAKAQAEAEAKAEAEASAAAQAEEAAAEATENAEAQEETAAEAVEAAEEVVAEAVETVAEAVETVAEAEASESTDDVVAKAAPETTEAAEEATSEDEKQDA